MARKARAEVEGGLYHVITRGNNRGQIFNSEADYKKFLSLLAVQKQRLPFFLYAFCLMTNHVHLLIERQADTIGRIMHRVLTGYSRYYNRRYRRVGHLLEGRHKSILCQSDRYLSELVRYIHLNPVRANMVAVPGRRCKLPTNGLGKNQLTMGISMENITNYENPDSLTMRKVV